MDAFNVQVGYRLQVGTCRLYHIHSVLMVDESANDSEDEGPKPNEPPQHPSIIPHKRVGNAMEPPKTKPVLPPTRKPMGKPLSLIKAAAKVGQRDQARI